MILTADMKEELMFDEENGFFYYRILGKDELFEVVIERFSVEYPTEDQVGFLHKKLEEAGFSEVEILNRLVKRAFDRWTMRAAGL